MSESNPILNWTAAPFPPAKVLEGHWCRLEPLDPAKHLDDIWEATTGHDSIWEWLPAEPPKDKETYRALLQSMADNKTIVVFSDDLDKALASFVIANGAAATGKRVTMFFTFWGLNVIKKREKPAVRKDLMGRMFGWMLPAHSGQLHLSKLNMWGMGSRMMRGIMRRKKIDSLEELMRQARESSVEMIACTMSMDVMGVRREELLDGITLGGVASYLDRTEESNLNLFI